jgi:phage N-6-adenine-methyltransferase
MPLRHPATAALVLVPESGFLTLETRASRIRSIHAPKVRKQTREAFIAWLAISHELASARRDNPKLRGESYLKWAYKDCGLDRDTAYELPRLDKYATPALKLYDKRDQDEATKGRIFAWPGWANALDEMEHGDRFGPRGKSGYYGIPKRDRHAERGTPQYVFDHQNAIHHFDLDVCATRTNAKCEQYFTKTQDALKREWLCSCAYMNPPYHQIEMFLVKMFEEIQAGRCKKCVCLLPSWTDMDWFHDLGSHGRVQFLKGRLKHEGAKGSAFFPSMLIVFTKTSLRRGDELSCSLLNIRKPRKKF